MTGKVHRDILKDAVSLLRCLPQSWKDTELAKLWVSSPAGGLHAAYLDAVARQAEAPAEATDDFGDLCIVCWKDSAKATPSMASLLGHSFTATSHFIDAFQDAPAAWNRADGYAYTRSAKQGFDNLVTRDFSKIADATVDRPGSLLLAGPLPPVAGGRITADWLAAGGGAAFLSNLSCPLDKTVFPPVSSLGYFYYRCLLAPFAGNNLLQLDVGQRTIAGLEFLGPVSHAVADACVPMHIRCTMDYCHQSWESLLEAQRRRGSIKVEEKLVKQGLDDLLRHQASPGADPAENIRNLILAAAKTTRDLLVRHTHDDAQMLWKAGGAFWSWYTFKAIFAHNDAMRLYNLAVAGTMRAIVQAYVDLSQGLTPQQWNILLKGPARPKAAPTVARSASPASEAAWRSALSDPSKVLGFQPSPPLTARMADFQSLLDASGEDGVGRSEVLAAAASLQQAMEAEFQQCQTTTGRSFCPLSSVAAPADREARDKGDSPDTLPLYGIATFRRPTYEECIQPEALRRYMRELAAHEAKARVTVTVWAKAAADHARRQAPAARAKATTVMDAAVAPLAEAIDDVIAAATDLRSLRPRRAKAWLRSAARTRTLVIPTFDDGPVCDDVQTPYLTSTDENEMLAPVNAITTFLQSRGLVGVFYVARPHISDAPDDTDPFTTGVFQRGVQIISDRGQIVAYHANRHAIYREFFLQREQIVADVVALRNAIPPGIHTAPVWRPPYGGFWTLADESAVATTLGLTCREWRIDSNDWMYHHDGFLPGMDEQAWRDLVRENLKLGVQWSGGRGEPWTDILMHVNRRTAAFLPDMLAHIETCYRDCYGSDAWGEGKEFYWLTPQDLASPTCCNGYLGPIAPRDGQTN